MAARVTEIDQQIACLLAERDALVQSTACPIHHLPVEIMAPVFLDCIPDNPLDRDAFIPAIVLGEVSRHWRAVALSTPKLWSSWTVAVDHGSTSYVELWLSRSQNEPLSIRLYHKDDAAGPFTSHSEGWWNTLSDFPRPLLAKIIEQSYRWQHVELNVPMRFLTLLAEVSAEEGLPHLTHLSIGSAPEDWAPSEDPPIIFCAGAPQLRSVQLVLESFSGLRRMDHVYLAYAQLTSFSGTGFTPSECLEVLAETPSLVHAVFYLREEYAGLISAPHPPLEHLQSLKLWAMEYSANPVEVIEHLTVPALHTLELGSEHYTCGNLDYELALMVGRSNECPIRHFVGGSIDAGDLVACLEESLLQIETLELTCSQTEAAKFLRRLALSDRIEEWTRFESLTIQCYKQQHEADFPFRAVLNVLETLREHAVPLRQVRLVWTSSLYPTPPTLVEARHFARFVKEGMQIYIGTLERSWI